ncbi:MAG TPA: hypothetical protein VHF51_03780 [Solirubrobacteraceae bacterium]|nr:hypothetical protein [Solirubrobacteraceae bacterium]
MSVQTATGARHALLERLIDHAALFPPASLPLREALEADRRAREGAHAWMLGRFVCPASRLEELVAAVGGGAPELSVVLDGAPEAALGAAAAAARAGVRVTAIELRTEDPAGWRHRVDAALGPGVAVYVEGAGPGVPAGLHAKLRCGGASREAFPSVEAVAAFVAGCEAKGTAFKATAGLHHALRRVDPASGVAMHGFLNLLAAACLAHVHGAAENELADVLAKEDAAAIAIDDQGLRAGGRHVDAAEIAHVRRRFFHGVGSCSFSEPVDDLRALGLLAG